MFRKLLIVDDEPTNRQLVVEMLGRQAYHFVQASNGEECLALAEQEKPDMIIMDWQMPRVDGMEALRRLKVIPDLMDIPVLFMSGIMTTPVDLMAAMEEGAVDFLQKPFDRLTLRARVRNMLMLSEMAIELKQKFEQLESSTRMIEALFAGITHPLVYYTRRGVIMHYNKPFGDLLGTEEAQSLTGRLIHSFFSEKVQNVHIQKDTELMAQGGEMSYELSCDLSSADFLFSKKLHYNVDGSVAGIICSMTDITSLKRSHEQLMEAKKRELVSSTLRLIHASELNNRLISRLGDLQKHVDPTGVKIISEIVKQNHMAVSQSVWDDFEARFENVYESFYQTLNASYPDLTPGERKLCALLRLNISSKDIAAITNQNPNSVDMARYRLRKKLNLSPEDNLVDFLLKTDR